MAALAFAASVGAVAPATGSAATNAPSASSVKEAHAPVLRLTVADDAGTVSVHHAASGRQIFSATLPAAPSSLVALGDRRHVAAVMGTANLVQLLDSGTWTEPHDDHTHSHVTAPRTVGAALASTKPSHVVSEGDDVVIFSDGSGNADRYAVSALSAGRATPSVFTAAFPHHGVGVPFGDGLLVSAAPAAASRPDAVVQTAAAGKIVARFEGCPGLHGETSGAGWAAFGCADGTLLLEGTPLAAKKLAYPAAAGALRVSTWNRSASGRHLAGALGTTGVLVLDRRASTQHLTRLDGTVHAVAIDDAKGSAIALTRDGMLHRIKLSTGAVTQSTRAIAPFTAPTGVPAPRLTATGGRIALTEPAARRALVFATDNLRQLSGVRTAGVPAQVALTGTLPVD
jgi:hypothetical protein